MKKTLLTVCLSAVLSSASAQQHLGQGLGVNTSCESLVEALNTRSHNAMWRNSDGEVFVTMSYAYIIWVQGFITATNIHRPQNGQVSIKPEKLASWLKSYCEKNPRHEIYRGAVKLVESLPSGYR